jgi:membrane protein DedA with SNARE-associated domain
MRRRFKGRHVDRALAAYRRFGVFAVIVPALLPPPAPFKIFVLLAGVAQMNPVTFSASIAVGRGVRYFGEGWLAVRYGEQAIDYIHEHSARVSLWLAAFVVAGGLAYDVGRRRRASAPAR